MVRGQHTLEEPGRTDARLKDLAVVRHRCDGQFKGQMMAAAYLRICCLCVLFIRSSVEGLCCVVCCFWIEIQRQGCFSCLRLRLTRQRAPRGDGHTSVLPAEEACRHKGCTSL